MFLCKIFNQSILIVQTNFLLESLHLATKNDKSALSNLFLMWKGENERIVDIFFFFA